MNKADIKQDTPRLVVEYQINDSGEDRFRWGVVGSVPLLTLIGFMSRVQWELMSRQSSSERFDFSERALVITFMGGKFDYLVHSDIPTDPLVGMLEQIKLTLAASQVQPPPDKIDLFGADGRPMYRR